MIIPSRQYFIDALNFSQREIELRMDFDHWLPDMIIDCHAHANGEGCVGNIPEVIAKEPRGSFPSYSIDDSLKMKSVFHPTTNVRTLRFSNPYLGINHRCANQYLLRSSPITDAVALLGLPDNIDYTIRELRTSRYAGLKMYPFYRYPPFTAVLEVFPDPILKVAEETRTPIILHLPQPLYKSVDEVRDLATRYPDLAIVIAHLGRQNIPTDETRAAYFNVADFDNVVFDTSMVVSAEIIEQVFDAVGPHRVLYGSDEPCSMLRYTRYMHPTKGFRCATSYPYHWLAEDERLEYGHLGRDAVHIHWQSLLAIRSTIEKLYLSNLDEVKTLVFYANSRRIFSRMNK